MTCRKKGLFFCLGALFFSSCAARITGNIEAAGSGDFVVSAALQPRISLLIRSLSAAMGDGTAPEFIIDGAAIARSMTAAPGISSVSFRNTGPAAVEGPVKISRIGDFLATAGGPDAKKSFIAFEQAPPGSSGPSRCTITLNRDSGPEILSLFSPEVSGYLSALMAPIATGEALTQNEYFAAVSSVYGQAIADEIRTGSMRVSIQFPGPISAVKGGAWSGNRAEFDIPLGDLLVLETPLEYEVRWK
ncbi:MAG: hypothetical protein LBG10_09470 [Treponema sp.]|jgi:hypothetical protein|nr:hypothetical protein [Treponema sp.]